MTLAKMGDTNSQKTAQQQKTEIDLKIIKLFELGFEMEIV
jgi:hypothetical protein